MLYVLLAAVVVWGLATIYLAYRFREFRKFLAGAFFVSWGIQLYLYFAKVSVPFLGMNLVFTPGARRADDALVGRGAGHGGAFGAPFSVLVSPAGALA